MSIVKPRRGIALFYNLKVFSHLTSDLTFKIALRSGSEYRGPRCRGQGCHSQEVDGRPRGTALWSPQQGTVGQGTGISVEWHLFFFKLHGNFKHTCLLEFQGL